MSIIKENGVTMDVDITLLNLKNGVSRKRKVIKVLETDEEVWKIKIPEGTTDAYIGFEGNEPTGQVFRGIYSLDVPSTVSTLRIYNPSLPDLDTVRIDQDNQVFHFNDFDKVLVRRGWIGEQYGSVLTNVFKKDEKVFNPNRIIGVDDYAFAGTSFSEVKINSPFGKIKRFVFTEKSFCGCEFGDRLMHDGYHNVNGTVLISSECIENMDLSDIDNMIPIQGISLRDIRIENVVIKNFFENFLKQLKKVKIGKIVKTGRIDNVSLNQLSQLNFEYLELGEEQDNYTTKDGVLYTKDMKELILCPMSVKQDEQDSFMIPDGVKSIRDKAFIYNETIKSVKIPDSMIMIGRLVFAHSNIKEIVLPDSVRSIGEKSFAHMSLDKFTISSNILNIENEAFCETYFQHGLTINEGVEIIGENAFFCTDKREEVLVLPSTVKCLMNESLKACLKIKIKNNRVFNLIAALDNGRTVVVIDENDESFIVPSRVNEAYRNYLNSAWNTMDKTVFMDAYKGVFQNLAYRDAKWTFAFFNYMNDREKYKEFEGYIKESAGKKLIEAIKDEKIKKAAEIVKCGLINEKDLRNALELSENMKNVTLFSYILQELNRKSAVVDEKRFSV